ncbi:methyltransferase [Aestuariibacter halophilus]|uniref:tRNA1(Val) (adenine(37)-N6)-methyltransferase n=1 Tax=Fluctibacter halophilus TaxID=226011 RepID=A0ABS8GBA3_9ALTE|nr:methyltransferase [Aestuariibacter halophilus]MCC2617875.1 methyltransferase [Aestuariibacter halophilus]
MSSKAGFTFKQFVIAHDQCAMKVGTDSIVLGSWLSPQGAGRILDVGTGSGLLAIMLAQRCSADTHITGIDIDPDAIQQATLNGRNSPWPQQLTFVLQSVLDFEDEQGFDLLVSNPPYFNAGLGGASNRATPQAKMRFAARQQHTLSHAELLIASERLLTESGSLALVLPTEESHHLEALAAARGWFCEDRLTIFHAAGGEPLRTCLRLSRVASEARSQTLVIRDENGDYTPAYRDLCRDYYLHF